MKVMIVGSHRYIHDMLELKEKLKEHGYEVLLPLFDNTDKSELEIVTYNREMMKQADKVIVMWDGASLGTIFDIGMAFAMDKPIEIAKLNKKSFVNLIKQLGKEVTYI